MDDFQPKRAYEARAYNDKCATAHLYYTTCASIYDCPMRDVLYV